MQVRFVRNDITETTRMAHAIREIQAITDQKLDDIIASVPSGLIGAAERAVYANFLKGRQDRLGWVFQNGGDLLPNLRGV